MGDFIRMVKNCVRLMLFGFLEIGYYKTKSKTTLCYALHRHQAPISLIMETIVTIMYASLNHTIFIRTCLRMLQYRTIHEKTLLVWNIQCYVVLLHPQVQVKQIGCCN